MLAAGLAWAFAPARPPATTAAHVVQRLLAHHLDAAQGAGVRGFTPQAIDDLRPFITAALHAAAVAWLAQPGTGDEAPEINGDPFTDSQEPVAQYTVSAATVRGGHAELAVHLADSARRWTLHYRLHHTPQGWRVDDVVLRDGVTLRGLLQEAKR